MTVIDVGLVPHVVYFLEDEETLAKVSSMLPLLLGTVMSPRVPINLDNREVTVLLDNGAEVSVLPKFLMERLIGDGSRHFRLGQSKSVRTFANLDVQLEGPWCLSVEICGVRLTHPFYQMDAEIPAVVGIDLLTAAKLVIDVMNRCMYSHHFARLDVEPATQKHEPVFKVDNATHFDPLLSPSSSVTSPSHSGNLSMAWDLGGPSLFSEVGAPLVSFPSADAHVRPSLQAPVPAASSSTTVDPRSQDAMPETCRLVDCHSPPLLPPPHSLSPSAPLLLTHTSPHPPPFQSLHLPPFVHSPPVQVPCVIAPPDRLPVTLPLLPRALCHSPPAVFAHPPPPLDPHADPPHPPPELPDPPDPPPDGMISIPRYWGSLPPTTFEHCDVTETSLRSATVVLPFCKQ